MLTSISARMASLDAEVAVERRARRTRRQHPARRSRRRGSPSRANSSAAISEDLLAPLLTALGYRSLTPADAHEPGVWRPRLMIANRGAGGRDGWHAGSSRSSASGTARVRQGGSESARKKHTDRGKMLARDRIDALLDPGSPFLELSPLAAYGMYGDDRATPPPSQRQHRHRDRPGRGPASAWSWPTTRRSRAAPTTR